jgi:hypothetical protein
MYIVLHSSDSSLAFTVLRATNSSPHSMSIRTYTHACIHTYIHERISSVHLSATHHLASALARVANALPRASYGSAQRSLAVFRTLGCLYLVVMLQKRASTLCMHICCG